jgi:hypothetical protein
MEEELVETVEKSSTASTPSHSGDWDGVERTARGCAPDRADWDQRRLGWLRSHSLRRPGGILGPVSAVK